ncbi:MAG: hypothetical protein OEZ13_08260 [Spirochaetia bacterium]|nr:hypothetical protein [Spirochaetia bacterium]
MKKVFIFYIFSTLLVSHGFSENKAPKRIAVLPFSHDKSVSKKETDYLTEKVRTALIQTGIYDVISNDQIENMMNMQAKKQAVGSGSCMTDQCIIDLGNALESEKILVGNILEAFGQYTINAKILDVAEQKYEKAEEVTIVNKKQFPNAAESLVAKLSGKEVKDPEKLVNRRVLILDFVNTQKEDKYNYLAVSIPDAFLDPLQNTGTFELMNRNLWQKQVKEKKYDIEEAYDEDVAVEFGQKARADVVVIGSFSVVGGKMQMVSKAVEVSSERVMVSKTERTDIDSNMFEAIEHLANKMSQEMKNKLPPLPQKVIEKIRIVGSGPVTYGGMLWRTALIPGWGHLYAYQKRGYAYLGLWAAVGGAFIWSHFDYTKKLEAYESTLSSSEDDYINNYNAANDANKMRAYISYACIGVFTIVLTDILITGGRYAQMKYVDSKLKTRAEIFPDFNILRRIYKSNFQENIYNLGVKKLF